MSWARGISTVVSHHIQLSGVESGSGGLRERGSIYILQNTWQVLSVLVCTFQCVSQFISERRESERGSY